MKKFISIIMCLILMFIMTTLGSCTDKSATIKTDHSNTYIEGQDDQYMYHSIVQGTSLQHCQNGYYFTHNFNTAQFLYYIDGRTLEMYPVCNKTDCLHDKETDEKKLKECNAYFNLYTVHTKNIYYYNGDIYYLSDGDGSENYTVSYFKRFNLETQTKDTLLELKDIWIDDWIVHRGYLYFATALFTDTDNNGDTSITNKSALYRVGIGEKKEDIEMVSDFDRRDLDVMQINQMQAYGNYVYYTSETIKSGTDILNSSNNTFSEIVCCYNITTGEVVSLNDVLNEKEISVDGFYNDKLFYRSSKNTIHTCELNGQNPKLLFEHGDEYVGYNVLSDGKYFYLVDFRIEDAVYYIVFDEKFNYLNKVEIPFTSYSVTPYDENYIIRYIQENNTVEVIDKSDIASSNKLKSKVLYSFD